MYVGVVGLAVGEPPHTAAPVPPGEYHPCGHCAHLYVTGSGALPAAHGGAAPVHSEASPAPAADDAQR